MKTRTSKSILMSIILFMSAGIFASDIVDPDVVKNVDLNKYSGLWHEIARYPTFFQRKCIRSSATYQVLPDNRLSVYNVCYKKDGKTSDINGVASIPDLNEPGKLKVRFNVFAKGDYWITLLDSNYQWAVVSAPEKKSLFILSRTAPMKKETLDLILLKLEQNGFDLTDIIYDQYEDIN